MASPSLELQGAIIARLKADPAVAALVNGRVYDSVPANAQFPYITYGNCQLVSFDAECITAFEVFQQIDCWSRGVGYPEVKNIEDAVRRALHNADIVLSGNALASFEHHDTNDSREADGLTSRARMNFEGFIEQR